MRWNDLSLRFLIPIKNIGTRNGKVVGVSLKIAVWYCLYFTGCFAGARQENKNCCAANNIFSISNPAKRDEKSNVPDCCFCPASFDPGEWCSCNRNKALMLEKTCSIGFIPTFLEGSRKVAKEILAKFNARDGPTVAQGLNHASVRIKIESA